MAGKKINSIFTVKIPDNIILNMLEKFIGKLQNNGSIPLKTYWRGK